jgi:hypothetical protein
MKGVLADLYVAPLGSSTYDDDDDDDGDSDELDDGYD